MISIFVQPCDCSFAKSISSIPSDLGTSLEALSTKPNLNPDQPTNGPSSSICCNATFLSFFLTRKSRWSLGGLKKWSRIFFCNDGVEEYHLSIGELSPGFFVFFLLLSGWYLLQIHTKLKKFQGVRDCLSLCWVLSSLWHRLYDMFQGLNSLYWGRPSHL